MNDEGADRTLVPDLDGSPRAQETKSASRFLSPMRTEHRWTHTRAILDVVATLLMIAVSALLLSLVIKVLNRSESPKSSGSASVALPQAPISLAGAFRKGSASASLAIVEYSDFSCPYCGQFARDTLPKIERAFVDTGLVLYVYRHLPLPIHPLAFGAAKAADCAGQQGKFWSMHDLLFANQGMLEPESLMVYSRNLGLDQELFRGCQQEITEPNVTADLGSARELQIAGTPTFLVGRVNKEEVTVLARLRGAVPFEKMRQTLEALQKSLTADTRR